MSTKAPVDIAIEVTDGPSAPKILEAFSHAYSPDEVLADHIRPWFEIRTTPDTIATYRTSLPATTRVFATIIGISYESGTPGVFILTMNILDGTYLVFYNANTRKGALIRKL